MDRKPLTQRLGASLCAGLLLLATVVPAQAGMIGTGEILASGQADADRAQIIRMIERDAVQQQLTAFGVDPARAQERVARMSDAEIAKLQRHIDSAPAGGNSLFGAAVFIFAVLVVTDMFGVTDVFPFVDELD